MSFIAGHYAATWRAVSIGTTRDGFRLQETFHAEMIVTDDYGDVPVDGIQRGIESRLVLDWVDYDLMVEDTARAGALYAQTDGLATLDLVANRRVGHTLVSLAEELVLTATPATPAATNVVGGILTLTAPKAIVVSDIETILAARLRQGPCTFQLFPDPATPFETYSVTHAGA